MSRNAGRHRPPAAVGVPPVVRYVLIGLAVFALGVGGSFSVSRLWPDGMGARAGDTQAGDLLPGGLGAAAGDGSGEGLPREDGLPAATTTIQVPTPTSSPSATATTKPRPTPTPSRSTKPTASARPTPTSIRTSTSRPSSSPQPTRTASGESAPTSTSTMDATELEVLRLTNVERAKAGCGPVKGNAQLTKSATGHSRDMADNNYFSHTSQDGRTFSDRIKAAGYPGGTLAENIAAGQPTAAAVMEDWMNSPGHRANILNCAYKELGVGHVLGGEYGHYWTQNFGA